LLASHIIAPNLVGDRWMLQIRITVLVSISWHSTTPTRTPTRTSSPISARGSLRGSRRVRRSAAPRQSACRGARGPFSSPTKSVDFCPTSALFLASSSLGMHTCTMYIYTRTCTVHDKLSCTHFQNYTIGASLKSVSVPWNLSLPRHRHPRRHPREDVRVGVGIVEFQLYAVSALCTADWWTTCRPRAQLRLGTRNHEVICEEATSLPEYAPMPQLHCALPIFTAELFLTSGIS